jgi:hypothetical protein
MKWTTENLVMFFIVFLVVYAVILAICYHTAGKDEWEDNYK